MRTSLFPSVYVASPLLGLHHPSSLPGSYEYECYSFKAFGYTIVVKSGRLSSCPIDTQVSSTVWV